MRHSNLSIALLLFAFAVALSGCRNSHASLKASPSAASPAKPSAAPSSAQSFAHLSKHPPRDSEFTVYHNPGYGISFRYPRNYLLLEPAQDESDDVDSALLTQQSLEADQPGALLVATVLIPDDAYPNTTFASGHLQFVVNPHATAESCRALVAPPDSSSPAAPHDLFLQDIHFQWRDRGSVAPGTVSAGREYAGFSGGACYEFFLQAVSTLSADSVSPTAPADLAKILRPLEKSVSSFQLHAVSQTK
jgi:hypothetical protein